MALPNSKFMVSRRQSALLAGFSMLIIAIIAPLAIMGIIGDMLEPSNAAQTTQQLLAGESLFRIAIVLLLVVAILDVLASWALYLFFELVSKELSLLAAWFRLTYTAILVASTFFLVQALQWLHFPAVPGSDPAWASHQTLISVENFFASWELGLGLFSFHLPLLGYLAFRAGYMGNILGILLFLSGADYLIDGLAKLLSPTYSVEIAAFTFIGELVLIFWLLFRGRQLPA